MGAVLDHPAPVVDQHPVGLLRGGQPVSDGDHGPPLGQLLQRPRDAHLREGVHGRGGLVQDQQVGVGDSRPGQGDQLAFPHREGRPPFAHLGVQAQAQLGQPPRQLQPGESRLHLPSRSSGAAHLNVLEDRPPEQRPVLGDHHHPPPQRLEPDAGRRLPPQQHPPGGGVHEPGGQLGEGGLARSGLTHHRRMGAGGDLQVHVRQGGGPGRLPCPLARRRIPERHPLEGDPQRSGGQVHSAGARIGYVGGDVQHVEHPPPSGHRRLRFVDRLAEHLHRLDEQLHQEEERHHRAQGGAAVHDQDRPDHHHRRDHQRSEHLADPGEPGRYPSGPSGRAAVVLDGFVQLGPHPLLDPVGPDHRRADHRLGQGAEHDAQLLPRPQIGGGQPDLESAHGVDHQRQGGHHGQEQLPRVQAHHRHRHQRLAGVHDEHQAGPLHEAADLIHIGCDPRHQHPPLLRGLMEHRQVVDVTEGPDPQARQRSLRHAGQAQMHEPGGQGGDHHRRQGEPDHADHEAQVDPGVGQAPVQHLLDGDRDDDPPRRSDRGQPQAGGQAPLQLRRQAQPPPHRFPGGHRGAVGLLAAPPQEAHRPASYSRSSSALSGSVS